MTPPAWALEGGASPPTPPPAWRAGLIAWYKGENIVEGTGPDAGRVVSWTDATDFHQDLDTVHPENKPFAGVDDIDGIPCVTFPLVFADGCMIARDANLVDSDGAPITIGPRTVVAVMLPRCATGFVITGGPVVTFLQESPPMTCVFDLESNLTPNGAYAFAPRWRSLFASANEWTPQTGGPGGPYDGVPTLGEWQLPSGTGIAFYVNNALTPVAPTTRSSTVAVSETGIVVGNGGLALETCWLGAFSEIMIWDYDLSENPAARAELLTYIAERYPSIPLVV